MNVGVRVAPKPMSQALKRNVARVREIFEQGLDRFGGPWLAGAEFTAADAFYAPVAFRIRTYGLDVGRGAEWVERVIAHPAMQDWEAQALAETWREASHEDELAAAGTITADYRQGWVLHASPRSGGWGDHAAAVAVDGGDSRRASLAGGHTPPATATPAVVLLPSPFRGGSG